MLAVGLSYMPFVMLRCVLSVPTLLRVFTTNGCWSLSNAFSETVQMIIDFFCSINVMDHIDWFAYVEPFLHPRVESHLIAVYVPFNVLLNSVCWYFIENFCISVYQGCWPVVFFLFFFYNVFFWFWYQDNISWSMYIFKAKMSLLQAAYCWIFFLYIYPFYIF